VAHQVKRLLRGEHLTPDEKALTPEQRMRLADEARDQVQAARSEYLKWRSGVIRFKTGLDQWIAQARHLRDAHTRAGGAYQAVNLDLATRVRELEDGIRRHRDRIIADADDVDHDEIDDELWSLVP